MRYLRMLSNSFAAGLLATAYTIVLVLQLNPSLALGPPRVVPLVLTIGLFYAVHLTVIFYVVLVVWQLLATELFSPAWLSVGVLVWLGAVASAAGAALAWSNVLTLNLVLEPAVQDAMTKGALILLAASALFVVVALSRARFGPRGRTWNAICVALIAAGSIAVPLALRTRAVEAPGGAPAAETTLEVAADFGMAERAGRVTVVAIDAGSLDFITGATAEGRLPNFGRILDAGAVLHLATLHPTTPDMVWAAVATGKLPQKNGVRSPGVYRPTRGGAAPATFQLLPQHCLAHQLVRLGFVAGERYTSAALQARPIWQILSRLGISVGMVAWPLAYPAPAVRGYIVSDVYDRLASTPSDLEHSSAIYPLSIQADAAAALESAEEEGADAVAAYAVEPRFASPGRIDRAYDRIARRLAASAPAQVTMIRYQSLDAIGHFFLRYAAPAEFGDVTDEERRRLGSVLQQHYAAIDEVLGRAIAALGPDDLLLVVSGYGMQPLGLGKRLLEKVIGDPELSGTHEGAPDGFLMAYGALVARTRLLPRASVLDVVPTLLYFLGLPVGRDMDGYARPDVFEHSFTDERPITFIPSYDR